MDVTGILPNIGAPVVSAAFDESAIDGMSIGEVAYAVTLFVTTYAKRLADPATAGEFARFSTAPGADWSGLDGATKTAAQESETDDDPELSPTEQAERSVPVAPENYYDTLAGLGWMLRQQQHAHDAILTHFAAHLAPAIDDQSVFLGVPQGVKAYHDGAAFFRDVLKCSRHLTKKIHDRVPYLAWTPGRDPAWVSYQPRLPLVAASFADGNISGENVDRIIGLDQDLTKYVRKVSALPDYKNQVLAAFEPALVDAAETATPDELSKAKHRWANTIAHAIDPDGPPVGEALRTPADNALNTKNFADGSGRIWMHATPAVYAAFKNWSLHQLNFNGTPINIPEDLLNFLRVDPDPADDPDHTSPGAAAPDRSPADGFSNINDLKAGTNPDATAQDADGNTLPAEDVDAVDPLTTGQRLAAIVIGMFQNLLTMNPTEIGAKTAHGASAQLMIVQDLQTAYETLGVGALPEAVRRPPGPAGVIPPIITRPNPEDPDTPLCLNPDHTRGYSPPSWTQYFSEALNIGPMHPKDTELLACDSKLVGQIWNGHHDVLDQHRAYRVFTPTQRRAILARDRGCQAPGCTVPAVYCQIHHIKAWQTNGLTNVKNSTTLCAQHHGSVHDGKWTIRNHHGITFFQPAPWLDPTQPLLRNLYWSL